MKSEDKPACGAGKIYIDGAARGNPGEAGIGIVIKDVDGENIRAIHKYIGQTTNNAAEWTAFIYGLQEAILLGLKEIVVFSDSELLVRQLKGEYRVKNANLKTFYEQFLHLRTGLRKLHAVHINRAENKEADKLANQAINGKII